LILCSPLASLHAQHSELQAEVCPTSATVATEVSWLTVACRELLAVIAAPRPGRTSSAHVQKERSGAATVKSSNAGASASMSHACAT
jgi:hypothetical protein